MAKPATATTIEREPARARRAEIGFEPDLEQQQNDADLRKQADDLRGFHPTEDARAENDAGHQLADDRRSSQAGCDLGANARRHQNHGDLQKDGRGVYRLPPALREMLRLKHHGRRPQY